MIERSAQQVTLDSAVLLFLLDRAPPGFGRLKVQKTVFLTELDLRERDLTVPHYKFIRYKRGPFSQQLWNDCDSLVARGFLDGGCYEVTERGRFIVDIALGALEKHAENREIIEAMRTRADWCAPYPGGRLMDIVYELEVSPDECPEKKLRIRDIPMDTCIIQPRAGGLTMEPDDLLVLDEQLAVTQSRARLADQDQEGTDELVLKNLAALNEARP